MHCNNWLHQLHLSSHGCHALLSENNLLYRDDLRRYEHRVLQWCQGPNDLQSGPTPIEQGKLSEQCIVGGVRFEIVRTHASIHIDDIAASTINISDTATKARESWYKVRTRHELEVGKMIGWHYGGGFSTGRNGWIGGRRCLIWLVHVCFLTLTLT